MPLWRHTPCMRNTEEGRAHRDRYSDAAHPLRSGALDSCLPGGWAHSTRCLLLADKSDLVHHKPEGPITKVTVGAAVRCL